MDHAVNGGTVKFVMCAWDDCEKDGYEMYKVVIETGNVDRNSPYYCPRPLTHIFCCERHRQYFIQSGLYAKRGGDPAFLHGMLPKGYGNSL
jgi:hypothetical protein